MSLTAPPPAAVLCPPSSPPRVDELEGPPVVGQRYLVPCLPHPRLRGVFYPVLGPRHEDPDVDPALPLHDHYDPRFLDLRLVRGQIDGLPPEQVAMVSAHIGSGDVVWREMICLREMPPFPVEQAPWLPALEIAYQHARAEVRRPGGCRTCPHRGGPVPPGGTCPIHGLRWGADGQLVPRG